SLSLFFPLSPAPPQPRRTAHKATQKISRPSCLITESHLTKKMEEYTPAIVQLEAKTKRAGCRGQPARRLLRSQSNQGAFFSLPPPAGGAAPLSLAPGAGAGAGAEELLQPMMLALRNRARAQIEMSFFMDTVPFAEVTGYEKQVLGEGGIRSVTR